MNAENGTRAPFLYLCGVTLLSVLLICINFLFNFHLPFNVDFLIGYVGALLVFVIWHSLITKGWKRSLILFGLSFIIAFTAETLGVNYGLVFGHYSYSSILGFKLLGVPLLAGLAWEPIIYAAFSITDILAPSLVSTADSWVRRLPSSLWMALVGALATTAWDMMIDPIAVSQGWWVWQNGGPYAPTIKNGVPINNFMGWLAVAFLINLVYRLVSNSNPHTHRTMSLSIYGPILLYSSLFLTSFGVTVTILQSPEVALIGVLAMGPFIAIALTNVNLFQLGLAALLGSGWMDVEVRSERIKTGNP